VHDHLHVSPSNRTAVPPGAVRTVTASRPTSCRHFRSAARCDLQVLACLTATYGPRSFASCSPKLWNNLLFSVHDSTFTLTLFCSRSKTHLFDTAYGHAHVSRDACLAVRAARYYYYYYYYYYAAFNAPCVGHKADESQARYKCSHASCPHKKVQL